MGQTMKKVMISMILAMVLAVFAAGAGWAAEPPMMEKPLTGRTLEACPVHQGMKINKNIYTDYKGQRIYFCCPACPAIFQKDP